MTDPKIVGLFKTLKVESDRASAVLAAAFLDAYLGQQIETKLVGSYDNELFKGDGALGSFSRKINLACAAGWIHADTAHDLNMLRKIRNKFAHDFDHELSFDSEAIKSIAHQLSTLRAIREVLKNMRKDMSKSESAIREVDLAEERFKNPRSAFEFATTMIAFVLAGADNESNASPTKPKSTHNSARMFMHQQLGIPDA